MGRGEHAKREHQAGSHGGRDAGADHPAAHGRGGVPCVRCPRGVEQRVVERRGSLGRRLAARQPASQRIDVGRPGRGHRVPSASIAARSAWRAWWTRRQIIPRATPSARAASSAGDPLDHAHHVGHAQVVRQLVELARDLRQRALVGQRGIERPRRARGQVGEPLQRAGAPPGGTAMHVRQVAADREQPGPRRRRALEPRYGAERLEERALDQVIEVGILGGVGPGEEAVQRPVVAIEQHPEREDARVRLQREVRLCDLDVDVHPAALDQDVIREEMRLVAHRSNRLQIGDDQGLRWRGDIAGVGIVDHHAARRSVREPHVVGGQRVEREVVDRCTGGVGAEDLDRSGDVLRDRHQLRCGHHRERHSGHRAAGAADPGQRGEPSRRHSVTSIPTIGSGTNSVVGTTR